MYLPRQEAHQAAVVSEKAPSLVRQGPDELHVQPRRIRRRLRCADRRGKLSEDAGSARPRARAKASRRAKESRCTNEKAARSIRFPEVGQRGESLTPEGLYGRRRLTITLPLLAKYTGCEMAKPRRSSLTLGTGAIRPGLSSAETSFISRSARTGRERSRRRPGFHRSSAAGISGDKHEMGAGGEADKGNTRVAVSRWSGPSNRCSGSLPSCDQPLGKYG